jgi:type 1 glutamine amidotransferase
VAWFSTPAQAAEKIRVLLVTGGHDYETNQFQAMFAANSAITVQSVVHPKAHEWLKAEAAKSYDVIVMYDMWAKILDEARADFIARLKEGKGLVALHHSLGSYQDWPEYRQIIGGQYLLKKQVVDGKECPASTYKHDVVFKVRVEPTRHPITRGVSDFQIHDETYGGVYVNADSQPLLTTDEATSTKTIGWARAYEGTRVATIQLGHDHLAYENPNYRKLVAQAIAWVAKRD